MSDSFLLRIGKIKAEDGLLKALKHNKRTLPRSKHKTSPIDATRSHLNYSLTGDAMPHEISFQAKNLMIKAGIHKPRKNQVMWVEIIFSLPVNRHGADNEQFFKDCLQWIRENMQGVIFSFDVHLDESAPHAHALILPLIEGKMQGNKLVGNRQNLRKIRQSFFENVARHYGLKLSNSADKASMEKQVLMALDNDPIKQSLLWSIMRDCIRDSPARFFEALGLVHTKRKRPNKAKTFAGIMTSKVKPR
jgi:hypothetical protein